MRVKNRPSFDLKDVNMKNKDTEYAEISMVVFRNWNLRITLILLMITSLTMI